MIHIRLDEQLNAEATEVLNAMGLSMSAAVRVFLTRVAQEKAIPFEVRVPNSTTIEAMEEARRGDLHSFNSISDLVADLNAQDS
jgi:DNA-damage-inducible protein J